MGHWLSRLKGTLLVLFWCGVVQAQPLPEKSQYSVFNRTPREFLRPLSPDRPDVTESAYTVDAGWLQVEMDVLGFARDRTERQTEEWSIAPLIFKLGLTNTVDFQIGITPYSFSRATLESGEVISESSTLPDLTLRVKVNLWGNDEGATALSVMPFITVPTHNLGSSVEGGIIFPFALQLAEDWRLGSIATVALLRNADDAGYHATYVNSLVLSYDFAADWGAFVELVSIVSTERRADWIASANGGLTYALTSDLLLDTGIRLGLTPAAPDVNVFVGLTVRF